MDLPAREQTDSIEEILLSYGIMPDSVELVCSVADKESVCIITDITVSEENIHIIKKQIFEKTGTEIYFAK